MASPYVISYENSFDLHHSPPEVWERLVNIERHARRWRWIRDLEVEPSPLAQGTIIRFVAAAPIPYRMTLEVRIDRIVEGRALHAQVHGDLEGIGSIEIVPAGEAARANLAWTVEMRQRSMRFAAIAARPILMFGHDWAVRTALETFSRDLDDHKE